MRKKRQTAGSGKEPPPCPSVGQAYQLRVEQLYVDYPETTGDAAEQEQHVVNADVGLYGRHP